VGSAAPKQCAAGWPSCSLPAISSASGPYSRRGSYPWTYHLGPTGHHLLRGTGHIEPRARYQPRALIDYSYVIHDLQLNAWILAYRQLLDDSLIDWRGETAIHPPPKAQRIQVALAKEWTTHGLQESGARPVFPDAVLEIERDDGRLPRTFLLEHDRTRRVDKNFDKFRRYDAFLTDWFPSSKFARPGSDDPPYVLFICQDPGQRETFLDAADHEVTGYRWHPDMRLDEHQYVGRRRILFTTELDMHAGEIEALRLPRYPPRHPSRSVQSHEARRVKLPTPRSAKEVVGEKSDSPGAP
jgi:hypothetical protein